MDKKRVICAVRAIKDECAMTSCDECCFCDGHGDCKLSFEIGNVAPSEIDVEELEGFQE